MSRRVEESENEIPGSPILRLIPFKGDYRLDTETLRAMG